MADDPFWPALPCATDPRIQRVEGGAERADSVLAGLNQASGFLRRELGRRITIHNTPQLHFVYDESLERGADLSKLIQQAVSTSGASDSESTES